MTRTTKIAYRETGKTVPAQNVFEAFWGWIEGTPHTDEMWRVEANGDMVLVVDEETMIEILEDDMAKAYNDFDTFTTRDRETGENELHGLPYELCGTYTIRGVYDANQRLVDGERTYFFSTEF